MTIKKRAVRKSCSIEKKLSIIKYASENPGCSIRKIAGHFNVNKTTVANALKQQDELQERQLSNGNLKATRLEKESETNKRVWIWFQMARARGVPLNGQIIQEKAIQYSQEIGDHEFKASEGWLNSFRLRHQISEKVISGESSSANTATAEQWKSTLRELMDGYEHKDIFNVDETGYFYRSLPDRTLATKRDECKGGKLAKDRVTVVLTCSMTGEKLKPLIIGKSARPRCIRAGDIERLRCHYKSSPKAWMTRSLFREYLQELNMQMRTSNRRILLFLDNAPVHFGEDSGTLSNIKLIYFPPNMTCLLQPLDAGIIRSFKVRARKYSTLRILADIEDNEDVEHASSLAKKFTMLDAIRFVSLAWSEVSTETIKACFANCGFKEAPASQEADAEEENLRCIVQRVGIHQLLIEENLDCFRTLDLDEDLSMVFAEKSITSESEDTEDDPLSSANVVNDATVSRMSFQDVKSRLLDMARYFEESGMVEKSSILRSWHHELSLNGPPNAIQSKLSKFFKFISNN